MVHATLGPILARSAPFLTIQKKESQDQESEPLISSQSPINWMRTLHYDSCAPCLFSNLWPSIKGHSSLHSALPHHAHDIIKRAIWVTLDEVRIQIRGSIASKSSTLGVSPHSGGGYTP